MISLPPAARFPDARFLRAHVRLTNRLCQRQGGSSPRKSTTTLGKVRFQVREGFCRKKEPPVHRAAQRCGGQVAGTCRCHRVPGDGERLSQALATRFTPLPASGWAVVIPGCLEGSTSPSDFSLHLEIKSWTDDLQELHECLLTVLRLVGCCG